MAIIKRDGWQVISECAVDCDAKHFWKGVDVWIKRPHILNKRLCVTNELAQIRIEDRERRWERAILHIMNLSIGSENAENCILDLVKLALERVGVSLLQQANQEMFSEDDDVYTNFVLRTLIPKCESKHQKLFEIIVKDTGNTIISFVPCRKPTGDLCLVSPYLAYAFQYNPSCCKVQFLVYSDGNVAVEQMDIAWLKTKVLPKICQWIGETTAESLPIGRQILPSLGLISMFRFSMLYRELKEKYAKYLVEIWPERTDPTKYVYQVISIACYLLVLWEEERRALVSEEKQSFVDLGCGNGLLTHILSSEGHPGIGIDLKRRKIWNLYGLQTKLYEQPIVPSSSELFPNYDWLIGSHSDELTPWIPVIAARSSLKMKFFLLPCCAHNFDAKFQRRNSKLSIYEDYIEFIREVASTCGFETKKDKLRIPSTKRICVVGVKRTFSDDQWPHIDKNIQAFIAGQCLSLHNPGSNGEDVNIKFESISDQSNQAKHIWATNFQARPAVQAVRNCTTLNADLKTAVIQKVVDSLLENSQEGQFISFENGIQKFWRQGSCLDLAEIAMKIPAEYLQKLKSEFGGLQTLLKNHYYIFEVVKGNVKLQNYLIKTPFPKKRKNGERKQTSQNHSSSTKKSCWFYKNYPDGCPLPADKCFFVHENSYL